MTPEQERALKWFQEQLIKSEQRYSELMEQYHWVVEKLFEQGKTNA